MKKLLPCILDESASILCEQLTNWFQAAGAQIPLSFIPSYSVVLGLTAFKGAIILAVSNAINAVSRYLVGCTSVHSGRQNTLIFTLFIAASSILTAWLDSIRTTMPCPLAPWLLFVACYSFYIAEYHVLFPALMAEILGIRQYTAANASILVIKGLGTMVGGPIGGLLLGSPEEGKGAYARVAYWDGALLMGAMVCCIGVRWASGRMKGWKWIA